MKQKDQRAADVLTADEAARRLRIHPNTLRRLAGSGAIPGIKIGSAWRFSAAAIEEMLRGHNIEVNK